MESSKSNNVNLLSDVLSDLHEAFAFYDKDQSGYISMSHFTNILKNFGFHKMAPREIDDELRKHDSEFKKRNCVDLAFCKYVIWYRSNKTSREDEATECFKVFNKKERPTISYSEIRAGLLEHVSANLSEAEI